MVAKGSANWHKEANGRPQAWAKPRRKPMSPEQFAFIEWLTDPNHQPTTFKEYAEQNGVGLQTLTSWRKDERFRAAWSKRATEIGFTPDRKQAVINAAYQSALGGEVRAMKLYLDMSAQLSPPALATDEQDEDAMTDEEMAAALGPDAVAKIRDIRSV